MPLLLTIRVFCCFMFIFMWFIECLQDFLHFTCGFVDIFSKKPFTNPHNRAYNKATNNKKTYWSNRKPNNKPHLNTEEIYYENS